MKSVSIAELFTTGVYLKPLLIMLTLHFIQQFCGINVIVFYLADIFIAAGFDIENSLSSAAIVSLTQVPIDSYRNSRVPVTYGSRTESNRRTKRSNIWPESWRTSC